MASWIRISYTGRLFAWLLVYSLLLVGCFIFFQYRREKEFRVSELNTRLQLVNGYIARELDEGGNPDLAALARTYSAGDSELRITVVDSTGVAVYDNSLDRLPAGNHFGREEIAKARRYGSGYALRRHSESTGETYFYSATRTGGGMIVRTALPYSVSLDRLLEVDYSYLWLMAAVAVAFCIAGYFATRRLGQHIVRLGEFAKKAERGEAISDTAPFPHDEVGDISNNIVRLYVRLQEAVVERDRQHRMALRRQMEKERIKKELTNNINHELKTPVASIQLCLETLQAHENMDGEKRREFVGRALAHAGRLKRLLEDVSLLTRIEDGGRRIAMEPVGLRQAVDAVVAECMPAAEARGMTIDNRVREDVTLRGNGPLLESVFYNLIDNAMLYSGGTRICLGMERSSAGKVTLTVSDNGHGVPEEHLERMFERFYRVDKGRSRAAGGTGLGLSIVKNAVLLHGGTVSVRNISTGGLMFTIVLPTAVS